MIFLGCDPNKMAVNGSKLYELCQGWGNFSKVQLPSHSSRCKKDVAEQMVTAQAQNHVGMDRMNN